MIAHARLPGSLGALGLGLPDFHAYWNVIKDKIADLQNLGYQISLHQQHLGNAKRILVARNDRNQNVLDDEIAKTQDDLDKWWKIKGLIDKWLPTWMQGANDTEAQVSGLGFIVIPLMAIAAITVVVTQGMALLQDYAMKRSLTADVIAGKVTSGQAADILSIPRPTTVVEETIQGTMKAVGTGLGFGIPTVLLVGGGIYFAYASGMLNGLMGMLKGSVSSSTSSSGA